VVANRVVRRVLDLDRSRCQRLAIPPRMSSFSAEVKASRISASVQTSCVSLLT
jgi:hypothetical protein